MFVDTIPVGIVPLGEECAPRQLSKSSFPFLIRVISPLVLCLLFIKAVNMCTVYCFKLGLDSLAIELTWTCYFLSMLWLQHKFLGIVTSQVF